MSIARQYAQAASSLKRAPQKFAQPKKEDPLIAARAEVKALQHKVQTQIDEINRLKRELSSRSRS